MGRALFALVVSLLAGSLGCWEQWSNDWFPQMKWQKAIQAFERTPHDDTIDPFVPPDDTVPVQGFEPPVSLDDDAQANALQNPRPMSVASLDNGRQKFERFCSPCHGVSEPTQKNVAAVAPWRSAAAQSGSASIQLASLP